VGSNRWLAVQVSGTVGAAAYAAHKAGIPAIAFSGESEGAQSFEVRPVPERSLVYAELALILTETVIAAGKPYLPEGVFLNVNFPKVEGDCTDPSKFQWVLSRINPPLLSVDHHMCGSSTLPTEDEVGKADGCYISVSPGNAADKTTENDVAKQAAVAEILENILVCLPSDKRRAVESK
jgi:broad specificity polyphosphatase/5'/3'-nucleotidase SurE